MPDIDSHSDLMAGSTGSTGSTGFSGSSIVVTPAGFFVDVVLTATTAISHHDPDQKDDGSNKNLFNRQAILVPRRNTGKWDDALLQGALDAFGQEHAAPTPIAAMLTDLLPEQVIAAALLRVFVDTYNSADGAGLFSKMERYEMLRSRAAYCAVRAVNLGDFWSLLCSEMQVPLAGKADDVHLLRLLTLPLPVQTRVLTTLPRDGHFLVLIARQWSEAVKAQSETYAARSGKEVASSALLALSLSAARFGTDSDAGAVRIEIPHLSANGVRHQLVREPLWHHLAAALDLPVGSPGKMGAVPIGAESLFVNGGNIRAGATQPSNPFGLAWQIRETFPGLDLLGGVADSFDIGRSCLAVATWLVCRENQVALQGTPGESLPNASLSVWEMLDQSTHTRQATDRGAGQMIWSFETLAPGTQVLCRFLLRPFTPQLTLGAFAAALEHFQASGGLLGGQGARGYGWMKTEQVISSAPDTLTAARVAYETYIQENAAALKEALTSGTLGSSSVVCK